MGRVEEFLDALDRVAAGGTALDPEVVTELLGLTAEGRDNATISSTLFITERAVSKHISSIFLKLGLPPSGSGQRRVMAVLAYLNNVLGADWHLAARRASGAPPATPGQVGRLRG